MRKLTTCPSCGSERIKKVRRTWEGDYHGRAYTAENLQFYECPDCAEKVYDPQAMRIIEALSPAFPKTAAPK